MYKQISQLFSRSDNILSSYKITISLFKASEYFQLFTSLGK